ncbi:uncharacterized protein C8Q71DRAFT_859236 [Rhodofomes roseus]|uniref:Uncharacterized protein n=1 Tax=Rhodofomes roseus TaxID=34475 RepID=A0ABQ8KBQ1_9APHY|nr:uncharacterized protein C8Q71DRAFT_859236 [Rhodofomes roseus]KAH9834889.1 hypothetical protein C8Q71DRAFT_859236 [Rhodofomes roseus]
MDIIRDLYTDGFLIFLAFLVFRVSRLLPSTIGGGDDVLLTPLISWSLEGVLNTRLYYKVKDLEVHRKHCTPFALGGDTHTRQRSGVLEVVVRGHPILPGNRPKHHNCSNTVFGNIVFAIFDRRTVS